MCRVIAVSNPKGGVGKTVSCVNLGIGLAQSGKKVLLIDADPQGSMTASLGYHNPDELPITLATILTKIVEDEPFEKTLGILHHQEGIDLIPANIELAGMEVSLVNCMNREKMPYRSSWLFKSYTEESLTHITITAYYNVDEAFLQTPTAAWGNLWDCRAALRKLVSSVYLESDLNLPFGKNGKFLFQLGYTPVVSDMKKIVQKAAASSFPTWTLAVWDMDTATFYMVKYDRSH